MSRDRAAHIAWAKGRATPYAQAGQKADAIASLVSDFGKWEGPPLYDGDLLQLMLADATLFRHTPADLVNWIEGFA